MDNYLKSERIRVFPSIGREASYDIEAELANEGNLARLTRNIYGNHDHSFVISKTIEGNQPFEFVIYGYYFKVLQGSDLISLLSEDGQSLYASVMVKDHQRETPETNVNYQDLGTIIDDEYGQTVLDTDGEFKGVKFTSSKEEVLSDMGKGKYTLLLVQRSEGKFSVPPTSLVHWTFDEVIDYSAPSQNKETLRQAIATDRKNIEDNRQAIAEEQQRAKKEEADLGNEISSLSSSLSTRIDSLSSSLSTRIDSLSSSLSTRIDNITVTLSSTEEDNDDNGKVLVLSIVLSK